MTRAGEDAALAELLSANLRQATIMESFEWRTLTTLYANLHRPEPAARAALKDTSPLGATEQLYVARMASDLEKVQRIFRRYMTELRSSGRFIDPIWPDPAPLGGLAGHLAAETDRLRVRRRTFDALADLPFASAE